MSLHPELNNLKDLFWQTIGWSPSLQQFEKFKQLQELLQIHNTKLNLTRLTESNDYWIAQVLDSLLPLNKEIRNRLDCQNIIDVGTGCGFPGLAIAIILPNAYLTLVDSIKKKTNAVKKIADSLGLGSRVVVLTERVEVTGQKPSLRGSFDLGLARAVAPTPVIAEYLIPLLNNQGEAIIYKGKWSQSDQTQLSAALVLLNAKIKKVDSFELPMNRGIRNVITIYKSGNCPRQYPRSIGIPMKRPLTN